MLAKCQLVHLIVLIIVQSRGAAGKLELAKFKVAHYEGYKGCSSCSLSTLYTQAKGLGP